VIAVRGGAHMVTVHLW